MKKIIFIMVIFLFSFLARASAETSIKAEVDKTKITADATFTYKLTLASTDKNIPLPQLPKFEGFNLVSQAQSSTLSFVKNNLKTVLVYAFILSPTDIGKFEIEPSLIKISGKTYSTEAFKIEVIQGKVKPAPKSKQEPSLPEGSLPESEQPQYTL